MCCSCYRLLCSASVWPFHWGGSSDYHSQGEIKSKVDWSDVGRAGEKDSKKGVWKAGDLFHILLSSFSCFILSFQSPCFVIVSSLSSVFFYSFFNPPFADIKMSVCSYRLGLFLTCGANPGDSLLSFLQHFFPFFCGMITTNAECAALWVGLLMWLRPDGWSVWLRLCLEDFKIQGARVLLNTFSPSMTSWLDIFGREGKE